MPVTQDPLQTEQITIWTKGNELPKNDVSQKGQNVQAPANPEWNSSTKEREKLKQELGELKKEMNALKKENEELKSDMNALEKEGERLRKIRRGLRGRVFAKVEIIKNIQDEAAAETMERDNAHSKEVHCLREGYARAQAMTEEKDKEINCLKKAHAGAQAIAEETEKEMQRLQSVYASTMHQPQRN
ncbi:hypothetical protein NMY22_g2024 [Coprinellus aureogranulatus]|nr:hypothetical protein NMY22_g2024 [Coprinellus aureogranulatus]